MSTPDPSRTRISPAPNNTVPRSPFEKEMDRFIRQMREDVNRASTVAVFEAMVRELVYLRDRDCVLRGRLLAGKCFGPPTPHHRRKAGAGGAYVVENLVHLCAGHNTWVEDHPDLALEVAPSLVVREGDPEWEGLGRRAARFQ